MTDEAWISDAACKGRLDLFYAPHAERPPSRARREAEGREVCAACPVRRPCQDYARGNGELGLWAGETEEDRRKAGYPPTVTSIEPVRRSLDAAS